MPLAESHQLFVEIWGVRSELISASEANDEGSFPRGTLAMPCYSLVQGTTMKVVQQVRINIVVESHFLGSLKNGESSISSRYGFSIFRPWCYSVGIIGDWKPGKWTPTLRLEGEDPLTDLDGPFDFLTFEDYGWIWLSKVWFRQRWVFVNAYPIERATMLGTYLSVRWVAEQVRLRASMSCTS